jgi:hypothetical protein
MPAAFGLLTKASRERERIEEKRVEKARRDGRDRAWEFINTTIAENEHRSSRSTNDVSFIRGKPSSYAKVATARTPVSGKQTMPGNQRYADTGTRGYPGNKASAATTSNNEIGGEDSKDSKDYVPHMMLTTVMLIIGATLCYYRPLNTSEFMAVMVIITSVLYVFIEYIRNKTDDSIRHLDIWMSIVAAGISSLTAPDLQSNKGLHVYIAMFSIIVLGCSTYGKYPPVADTICAVFLQFVSCASIGYANVERNMECFYICFLAVMVFVYRALSKKNAHKLTVVIASVVFAMVAVSIIHKSCLPDNIYIVNATRNETGIRPQRGDGVNGHSGKHPTVILGELMENIIAYTYSQGESITNQMSGINPYPSYAEGKKYYDDKAAAMDKAARNWELCSQNTACRTDRDLKECQQNTECNRNLEITAAQLAVDLKACKQDITCMQEVHIRNTADVSEDTDAFAVAVIPNNLKKRIIHGLFDLHFVFWKVMGGDHIRVSMLLSTLSHSGLILIFGPQSPEN